MVVNHLVDRSVKFVPANTRKTRLTANVISLAIRKLLTWGISGRSFGGPLDQSGNRLASYQETIQRELERCKDRLSLCRNA